MLFHSWGETSGDPVGWNEPGPLEADKGVKSSSEGVPLSYDGALASELLLLLLIK